MNDTFDDFNFSSIQVDFSSPKPSPKHNTYTEKAGNAGSTNVSTPNLSTHKTDNTDISFDDSLFLSTIETPELLETHKDVASPIIKIIEPRNEEDAETLSSHNQFSRDENLWDISSWNLPDGILEKYIQRNIVKLFPWQVECLTIPGVVTDRRNLIYSAPTSAGKTLVAEILAIKTVLDHQLKTIIVLPFVSVVREKMFYLQEILSSSGIRVEGFMGSYNPPGGFQSVQVAICTIEKANGIINRLLEDGNLNEIGCVVVDEMHLLGDPNRGYLLELLLAKLRYISRRSADIRIQIVGMSATLPNLAELARWLDAELYVTKFRPIPLYEHAQVCGEMYDGQLKLSRKLSPHPDLVADTDNILQLCLETILESCSVLIFCPTKNWCENLAQQIAQAFWKLGSGGQTDLSQSLRTQIKCELITELLEQLRYCPVGLDQVLQKTVSFGVAYHHAGLTMDERDIIEGAFRNGAIRVLVATSTLSSGVNLPAKRVIIRTPNFHGKPMDILTYRQMIGRAGRMGKDTSGESILVCQKSDYNTAKYLMSGELQPIESCLEGAGKLKRAILEVVASSVASTPEDVNLFTSCTLLAQKESATTENPIKESLDFLISNEFIRLQRCPDEGGLKYVATSLGKACLNSSIPPDEGLALFAELERARRCIVLETELHLIYLVTPYSACNAWPSLDWMHYLNVWEKLSPAQKRVGDLVGVEESYVITNATRGQSHTATRKLHEKFLVHKRFFVALALQDLVDETPLSAVASKFGCNRGLLQSLQLTASTFAGMVTSFSKQLGWSSVELLIGQFQDRLQFGVARDLLDLMRLPLLNCKTARALYDSGRETLIQLANCDFNQVENVLHKVGPFRSEKVRDGETSFEFERRTKLKNIWICGKEGLTGRQAAELIVTSARKYLKVELGLKEAKWDRDDTNKEDDGFSSMDDNNKNLESLQAFSGMNLSSESSSSLFSPCDISIKDQAILPSRSRSDESLFEDSSEDDDHVSDAFISTYCSSQTQDQTNNKRPLDQSQTELSSPRKKTKFHQNISQQNDVDLSEFEIINVSSNLSLYQAFLQDTEQIPVISLALACSKLIEASATGHVLAYKNFICDGFAIMWGGNTVYYLSNSPEDLRIVQLLSSRKDLTIKMFDALQQLKMFKHCCDIEFQAQVEDCKVADWILEPEGTDKNLQAMTVTYFSKASKLSQICGNSKGVSCVSLDIESCLDSRLRSCTEALLTWYLVEETKSKLCEENYILLDTFYIEMQCRKILSEMEWNGINVDEKKLRNLVDDLNKEISEIEKSAFKLTGRRFSFTSLKQVSKILGLSSRGRKVSIKKEVLENCKHPIAPLVLRWRKLHHIVTGTIQPLVLAADHGRIHGSCILNTATGRVSMHEPNLQNVPKNFELCTDRTISCRDCFVPGKGKVMLSADFCQLELRLLAHLSKDGKLCATMSQKGDVFKTIAARWNHLVENQVTVELRQQAKQLCYGIIYGMGSNGLASQLKIDEKEAATLMRTFKESFPGIQNYISKVIDDCRKFGFVETIAGRRRYLSRINDSKLGLKSQAERQAVNSTIQGSAADLVKRAMVDLEKSFCDIFGVSKPVLLLQLHDELVYEVCEERVKECADILRKTLERSPNLSIPFPVRLKRGKSWGELVDY